ncbi:unnamed protein product [Heterobilharzia americana]|nr:unnamed protein product [Heterobilharzia americana]
MLSYNVLGVAKEFTKGLDLVTDRKVFQQTTNLAAIQSSSYTLTTNPLKEVDSTVHDEISKNYYTVRTNLRNQPLIEISLIAGSPPPEPSSHKDTNLPSYQAPEEVVREILISPSDCILPRILPQTVNNQQQTNSIQLVLLCTAKFLSFHQHKVLALIKFTTHSYF